MSSLLRQQAPLVSGLIHRLGLGLRPCVTESFSPLAPVACQASISIPSDLDYSANSGQPGQALAGVSSQPIHEKEVENLAHGNRSFSTTSNQAAWASGQPIPHLAHAPHNYYTASYQSAGASVQSAHHKKVEILTHAGRRYSNTFCQSAGTSDHSIHTKKVDSLLQSPRSFSTRANEPTRASYLLSHHNEVDTLPHAPRSFSTRASESPGQSASGQSIDQEEAEKFAQLSAQWWNPSGPFAPLHFFNPARCQFIRGAVLAAQGKDPLTASAEPLQRMRVLDVGCGGGLLSESMARMGAQVHGIDITSENVMAARQHAAADPGISSRIK
eukprot:gene7501-647_t